MGRLTLTVLCPDGRHDAECAWAGACRCMVVPVSVAPPQFAIATRVKWHPHSPRTGSIDLVPTYLFPFDGQHYHDTLQVR